MSEILFTCDCGMLLKVHGDELIGSEIVCPSCGTGVLVPPVSSSCTEPNSTNSGSSTFTSPVQGGQRLGLLYLGGTTLLTIALAKFVLMPVIFPTPSVPDRRDPSRETPAPEAETVAKATEAPLRLLKKPRDSTSGASSSSKRAARSDSSAPGGRPDTIPTAASTVPATPRTVLFPLPSAPDRDNDDDVTEVPEPAPPSPPVAGPGATTPGTPKAPSGGTTKGGLRGGYGSLLPSPSRGRKGRRPTRGGLTPSSNKPTMSDMPSEVPSFASEGARKESTESQSELGDIDNLKARRALEFARKNTGSVHDTWTAEQFLAQAQREAKDDPKVAAEVKKLRELIKLMRDLQGAEEAASSDPKAEAQVEKLREQVRRMKARAR